MNQKHKGLKDKGAHFLDPRSVDSSIINKSEVWTHSCGGQVYRIHKNGRLECIDCGNFMDGMHWSLDDKKDVS